jgi:hypothetical protein
MRKYAFTAVLAVGLALAGCKGSSGPGVATAGSPAAHGSAGSGPSPAADEGDRALQFQQCMREHGVEVHTSEDKGGVSIAASPGSLEDKQKMTAATEACRMYLPGGGDKPELSPEDIDRLRRFAQCMRDHGVPEWPDPDPQTGELHFDGEVNVKRNPKLPDALKACENLQPGASKGVQGG